MMDKTLKGLKIHPALGWITMVPIPDALGGKVEQEVDEQRVKDMKEQLEEHPLLEMLGLGNRMQIDEESIRNHIREQSCTFKSAVLVEVGPMPPGYTIEATPNDTIYYHEGKGIAIGDYTLMMAENIIGWVGADESSNG